MAEQGVWLYEICLYLTLFDLLCTMAPTSRFEPSSIKNKFKREDIAQKNKKAKGQLKLQKRLAQAKLEANDPAAKKVGLLLSFFYQLKLNIAW